MTKDPLINSVPESTIECRSGSAFHLFWAKLFQVEPTAIDLLRTSKFVLAEHVRSAEHVNTCRICYHVCYVQVCYHPHPNAEHVRSAEHVNTFRICYHVCYVHVCYQSLFLINIHPLLPPTPTAEKSLCFFV